MFKVKAFVDRLYVIFPFEVDFYKNYGVEAHYFGHPLLDEIHPKDYAKHEAPQAVQPTIALLPGSRKQEISYLLPEYMKVAKRFPNYTFQVAALRGNGTEFYNVHPSEGGHTEFCAMTFLDFEFREFVKAMVKE